MIGSARLLHRSNVLQATRRLIRNQKNRLSPCASGNPPLPKLVPLRYSFRRLSSTQAPTGTTNSTPPLAVRTALVATTTAIGTPAFPVVGIVNFGLRYVVWDYQTRSAILGASTVIGGVVTLVNFAAFDVLPIAYSYGQLFLPFALVNGGLAGTAYLILDAIYGTVAISRFPWTGAAIGGFVGLVGPVSGLYDLAVQWCYDMPEFEEWISYCMNNSIILPISVTTGAMVGLAMHPLLYYPIMGIPGTHWVAFSAPLLAGAAFVAAHLYSADYFDSEIFPPETYLTAKEKSHLMLVSRLHPSSLQVEDWGPQVGYQPPGSGGQARESIRRKLEATKAAGDRYTDMVFDSKRKAWLHYVTGGAFGNDYAVHEKGIPSQTELNHKGRNLLSNDGTVAFLVQSSNHTPVEVREKLVAFASNLQTTNRVQKGDAASKNTVAQIELASHGIALLMTLRKEVEGDEFVAKEIRTMEQRIRKLVPGIMLYKTEEGEDTERCSVESQLHTFGWKGLEEEEDLKYHKATWRSGLENFQSARQTKAITWAATGLGVILLSVVFGGRR